MLRAWSAGPASNVVHNITHCECVFDCLVKDNTESTRVNQSYRKGQHQLQLVRELMRLGLSLKLRLGYLISAVWHSAYGHITMPHVVSTRRFH
jgi:hypothetical protein